MTMPDKLAAALDAAWARYSSSAEDEADFRAAAIALVIAELEEFVISGMWTAAENDPIACRIRDRIAELRQEVKA